MTLKKHSLLAALLKHVLGTRQPAMQPGRQPAPAAPLKADNDALSFRPGAEVTFITPLGAYAGKPAKAGLRAAAEQQFHTMEPPRDASIH